MKWLVYLLIGLSLSACATTSSTLIYIYTTASVRGYYEGCLKNSKTNTVVDEVICKSYAQKHAEEINSAMFGGSK
jgi:hypothetical protein